MFLDRYIHLGFLHFEHVLFTIQWQVGFYNLVLAILYWYFGKVAWESGCSVAGQKTFFPCVVSIESKVIHA